MDISLTPFNRAIQTLKPQPEHLGSAISNWRAGQILHALARGVDAQGLLQLRIGQQELLARSEISVKPGQTLTLEVMRGGETPELRVLLPDDAAQQVQVLKATVLRQALPRMSPLTESVQRLIALLKPENSPSSLSESPAISEVRQAVNQLMTQLPTVASINTAEGLKAALMSSGLFSEAQLIQDHPAPADLKTALLKVAAQLRSALSEYKTSAPNIPSDREFSELPTLAPERWLQEFTRQVEGALAGIQHRQILSLPTDDTQHPAWQLELPVRHGEQLEDWHIRVEQEAPDARGDSNKAANWSVTLQFNLTPLGPVHTRITVRGESVSGIFWAERQETLALIVRRIAELHANLERVGLNVERFTTLPGRPPAPIPNKPSLALIDTTA